MAKSCFDPCLEEDPGPWLLVEWACEPTSKLAAWFQSQGHDILRLCLPEWDMTEHGNTELVMDRIKSAVEARQPVLVWISIPCTAWCAWQRINLAVGSDDLVRRVIA